MPRLPPVPISPQARLLARLLAGVIGFGRDLLPVALELLGDELGEAGERALAHLRARDADHAGVVGLDDDPGVDLGAAAPACARGVATNGSVEAEREPAAGSARSRR